MSANVLKENPREKHEGDGAEYVQVESALIGRPTAPCRSSGHPKVPTVVLFLLENLSAASGREAAASCYIQYSLASISVRTRVVLAGSAGSSEPNSQFES